MRVCFKNLKPCPFSVEEKPKTAFVFMPFEEELRDVYKSGVKKTLEDLGWSCHRSDEKFDTPEIVCTICKNTQETSLILADLTGRNPNVFLEVGLAFGLEKYVVFLSQAPKDIPFDTRTFRTIIYDSHELPDLKGKIRTLVKSIKVTPRLPKESPEAAVEIARRRREHSKKIQDGALKPWQTNIEHYCKIGVVYSKDIDKLVSVEPKDPTDLKFFDVAKSHLESKYPDVLNAWEELKRVTSKHNKELASFCEEIRTSTIKELKIPRRYSNLRGRAPEEYITLDRFVENICEEMELRLQGNKQWAIGEPKKEPFRRGDEKFYHLAWGSYELVTSRDEKDVDKVIILINKIIETPRFIEKVKNLIKREDEIYRIKRREFETKIKDVIKSIELGNILEGKCRFCAQWEILEK